ncbi:unnamed protein product, partial [Urochloa humidicola]
LSSVRDSTTPDLCSPPASPSPTSAAASTDGADDQVGERQAGKDPLSTSPPDPSAYPSPSPSAMEKYNNNTRFAPLRDASFALRGALGSSSSGLEQVRGYTSSPLAALRPNMSAPGSRPLHTSRPLAAPVANRPLSPHLPLKKPQFSATFSISHRIFGIALGVAIISVPLATKFSLMFGV